MPTSQLQGIVNEKVQNFAHSFPSAKGNNGMNDRATRYLTRDVWRQFLLRIHVAIYSEATVKNDSASSFGSASILPSVSDSNSAVLRNAMVAVLDRFQNALIRFSQRGEKNSKFRRKNANALKLCTKRVALKIMV